ncbi:MAG: hypothetical protein V1878_09640 [bacterium]
MRKKSLFLFGIAVAFFMVVGAAYAEIPVYPVKGKVVNVLAAFDNPEGALCSMDGKWLFVSNSALHGDANKPFGWVEGGGSISRCEIGPNGELKMDSRIFIKDLTGPLGMAVLNVNTNKFPRGTIFATAGSGPMALPDGTPITDPKRHKPKLLAFDPDSGKILGEIKLCANSIFAKINGAPLILVNALAFDKKGNLYIVDTGFGYDTYKPAFPYKGGVWKIPVESIDALAEGKTPASLPQFIFNQSWPDGVEVSPITGKVWYNTVMPPNDADPFKGAYWAVDDSDFKMGAQPAPLAKGLGRLDGLDFTVRGTCLQTEISGSPNSIVVTPLGGGPYRLALEPDTVLSGPADIDIKTLADGSYLVFVPELTALDPTPWDDEVTVIWLPANFDQP